MRYRSAPLPTDENSEERIKMADENASDTDTPTPAEVEQLEFEFPNTDDYPSYDETDSDDGQAELPEDNFDETSVSEDEDEEGCGCVPS